MSALVHLEAQSEARNVSQFHELLKWVLRQLDIFPQQEINGVAALRPSHLQS
jgi:hypothetical protein